ncbi:hypothetical protein HAX54_010273, partial [Datura stramonium]|nr:hypothetical protein [Datura stramonium]
MAENNDGSSGVLVVSAGEEEKRMEGKGDRRGWVFRWSVRPMMERREEGGKK